MHEPNVTKQSFPHGAYRFTLTVGRSSPDPLRYRVSLDRSPSDLSQIARVTDKEYRLPGPRDLYEKFGETAVTRRLVDYLQKLVEAGQPLPDELPADWRGVAR